MPGSDTCTDVLLLPVQVFCEIARSTEHPDQATGLAEAIAKRFAVACTTHFDENKIAFGGSVQESIHIRWLLERMERLYPGIGIPTFSSH